MSPPQGLMLGLGQSLKPSFIRWMPIDTLPLHFSSFYQWGWMIFSISTWIHLWGWLTGSGSSGLSQGWDWDQPVDGQDRTLGLAPVWVGQHWGPLEGASSGEFLYMGVKGPGASSCFSATPSPRKRVRPGGNMGSSPSPPSTSNLTCFFSFSAHVGASSPGFTGFCMQV